jgi:hypothetical protein
VSGGNLYFSGGGGGCSDDNGGGSGGLGGGTAGKDYYAGYTTSPLANTGGGAGGQGNGALTVQSGGSGVGIIRVPTASYSGTTTGSPTTYTEGSDTVIVFKSSGTYTA